GKGDEAPVLHFVAHRSPTRMVAVLFAAARVAPRRLKMAEGIRADPDVLPRRRNGERSDALKFRTVGHRAARRIDVANTARRTDAPDAGRRLIVHVTEARDSRGRNRIELPAVSRTAAHSCR